MHTFRNELELIKKNNLYRSVKSYEPLSASSAIQNGKKYFILASNNYLGLTHHPIVKKTATLAVEKYGTGSGGARLTTGSCLLHDELEDALAKFKQTEAVRIFNTGYMANVGTISALIGPDDVVFSDELNHASIVDGCRLSRGKTVVYRHADMDSLEYQLKNTNTSGRRLIVTDGVFSMDGDIAPLPEIVELADKYEAMVMVDDAHAVGVIGKGGRGTVSHFGLEGKIEIQIGTMSKALAAEGGYVAGSKQLVDYLTNKARSFIFSTVLCPGVIAAALAALRVLEKSPELVQTLHDNAEYLKEILTSAGFKLIESQTPILPLFLGEAELAVSMAEKLKENGIIVSGIRPPTVPVGSSRLRITVSAAHTTDELKLAGEKIVSVGRELKILEE